MYERLYDEYEDQGFDECDVAELSGSEHAVSEHSGHDIADQELIEAFDKINPHDNIFAEVLESSQESSKE